MPVETTWSLEICKYCDKGSAGMAGIYFLLCEVCEGRGMVMIERAILRRE